MSAGSDLGERLELTLREAGHSVECVDSIDDMIESAREVEPDLVMLGSTAPCNRIEVVSLLAAVVPAAKTVLLFDVPNEPEFLAALYTGANGYISADTTDDRLVAAIEAVLTGESVIPRSMTSTLVRQLHTPGSVTVRDQRGRLLEFSSREWEVLCLLHQGRTTHEVAERLFISPATVRSHVSATMRKLDADDRGAMLAAVFAIGSCS